ncbi:MAG: Uma2 family endonuclease [Pirellulaceae bacterium]|nr:Uma2 family endonuclease [Pirellulaceae bacterium]
MERTPAGDLIIMPPTGGMTGRRNLALTTQLGVWCERDGTGVAFDSSTGFRLPRGGERSPDASWVRTERWNALTPQQQEAFPPLAPDFVAELRSPTDRLADLQEKLREYIASGVRLGWLIDPQSRMVWIYRPGREVEEFSNPMVISAAPELPGFELRLEPIWQ